MDKPAICGGEPVRDTKIFYGHQYIDDADIQAAVLPFGGQGEEGVYPAGKGPIFPVTASLADQQGIAAVILAGPDRKALLSLE